MCDVRAWCAVHTVHTCTGLVADGASGASWHRNSLVFIANALNHLDPKQLDGIGACQSFLLPPTATTTLTLSFDQVLILKPHFSVSWFCDGIPWATNPPKETTSKKCRTKKCVNSCFLSLSKSALDEFLHLTHNIQYAQARQHLAELQIVLVQPCICIWKRRKCI